MGEPQSANPIAVLVSNFLGAIKLFFPTKKNDDEREPASDSYKSEDHAKISPFVAEDEVNNAGMVTFPNRSFVPVKLGVEAENAERRTNPLLLWQVYAIGGIFVLSWAWTRWNERKRHKKPDDEPDLSPEA